MTKSQSLLGEPAAEKPMWHDLQSRLEESFEIRNALVACGSVAEIALRAVRIVRQKLESQTAAIFLTDKYGRLARVALVGQDRDGGEIEQEWFPAEICVPRQSFTWRAMVARPGSHFGQPQWTNNLKDEPLTPEVRYRYREKLGELLSAAAIPLNGRHRTFGVLEVINGGGCTRSGREGFSESDVFWLSLIATSVASAITMLGRYNEYSMLARLGDWLGTESAGTAGRDGAYGELAEDLVSGSHPYRACIIRVAERDEEPRVVGRAGDRIDWRSWVPVHPSPADSIAFEVFRTKRAQFWSDIGTIQSRLANRRWMKDNQLICYACLPLHNQVRAVGTLSLFASYRYEFSKHDKAYLRNVASLIVAFAESCRLKDELASREEQLARYSDSLRSAAHLSAMSAADVDMTRSRHDLKNRLLEIRDTLNDAQGNKRGNTIQALVRKIDRQVRELQEGLIEQPKDTGIVAVDLNAIIVESIQHLSRRREARTIEFQHELSPEVRPIMAIRGEIQDLVFNLLHNAVRAIDHSGKRDGLIRIDTGIVRDRLGVEYVQIRIRDNGCGIPREHNNKVFLRGFSNYQGGTGIGLYTSKNTIDGLGGTIEFESSVGRGTTFTVRIPWGTLAAERRITA